MFYIEIIIFNDESTIDFWGNFFVEIIRDFENNN